MTRTRVRWLVAVGLLVAAVGLGSSHASAGPRIAFSRDGDLFTIRPDGTGLRRVTALTARERSPAWSPDQRQIAFLTWNRRIVVVDADGTDRRRLYTVPPRYDEVGSLAWSPDGRRIAFSTARYTRVRPYAERDCGQLWWMWADGRDPHRVVWHQPHITGVSWSPDASRLAVGFEHQNMTVACGDDRPMGIAIVRSDGSHLRGLGVRLGTDPDWSPDGRWIAYRDWRRTCHICGEIWLVRPDGTRDHVLVPMPAREGGLHQPRYSPGGARLAANGGDIWVVRSSDGRRLRRFAHRVDSLDW